MNRQYAPENILLRSIPAHVGNGKRAILCQYRKLSNLQSLLVAISKVTIKLHHVKVSHQKIGDSPFGPLENMADKEAVLMFERMPFLRTCNIFDGRYFIWKTD